MGGKTKRMTFTSQINIRWMLHSVAKLKVTTWEERDISLGIMWDAGLSDEEE